MTDHEEAFHRPLCDRKQPLSSDVADALEQLVGEPVQLPRAFTRSQVVDQLVVIGQPVIGGVIVQLPPGICSNMQEVYSNRLTNSGVFIAGYRRYERRTKHPVVPVTDFFFKNVYIDGTVHDVLEAMSEFEINESLPKRPSRMRKNDDSREFERDDDGAYLENGPVAGVVIMPANSHYDLLRAWLGRRANLAIGHLNSTVKALEHARPGSVAVQALRKTTQPLKPGLQRALPQPKRKG